MLLIDVVATEVPPRLGFPVSIAPPGHPSIMVAFDQGGTAVGRGQWIGAAAFSSDGPRGAVSVQRTWRVSDDQAAVLNVPADAYAASLVAAVRERLNAVAARRNLGDIYSTWTVSASLRRIAPASQVAATSTVAPDGAVVTVRTEPSPTVPGANVVTTTRTPPAGSRERQSTSVATVPGAELPWGTIALPAKYPDAREDDWAWIALGALVVGGAGYYVYKRKTR
jgi:hypothetical protein